MKHDMTPREEQTLLSLLDAGDLLGAKEFLTSRDQVAPNRPSVIYHLGFINRLMNRLSEAVGYYRRAIALAPNVATFHLALGVALQQQGELSQALEAIRNAVCLEPSNANAWNSLGLTQKMSGAVADALKSYRRAQELVVSAAFEKLTQRDPMLLSAREGNGGKKSMVVAPEFFPECKSELRADLLYATVMNNIGGCYLALGSVADAQRAFLESIEFIPDGVHYAPPFTGLAASGLTHPSDQE